VKSQSISQMWHVLDVGSIWMKEFAAAVGELVPVKCWAPEIRNFGWCENWEREIKLTDPRLRLTSFPLQRGYARFPIAHLIPFGSRLTDRLLARTQDPVTSTLVCTSPFYASVAERWPGRVIYYLTDLTAAYSGMVRRKILALDRRMCRAADLVCPNSRRIGEYLRSEAECDALKILVVPNATRERNLLRRASNVAGPLPADLADLPRPIVGVIGNLSYNMDWPLLRDAVDRTPGVSWAFVGPADMKISDPVLRAARRELIELGGRVRFTGAKPYGVLYKYGRALDAAFLPYRRKEPTFSGSATRFYEHLAACRPILATRGVDELLSKEPLLKLVDGAPEVAAELERLRVNHFRDGYEDARWEASYEGTWETRARAMVSAMDGELAGWRAAGSHRLRAVR
jgi:glycosyltransferase involved in cell wall biosynthesis